MRRGLAWALVVLMGSGCATGRGVSVYGRQVTVERGEAGKPSPQGELIAAEPARLWVLGKEQVFEVPLSSVAEVRVRRHGFTPAKALLWTALGALITGGALAGACASLEDSINCAGVFGYVGVVWMVIGGLASASMERSSTMRIERPSADALSPYARYPQGIPDGLDPRTLPLPPPPKH